MTVKLSRFAPALGALLCLASANTASAQWFPFRGLFTPCPCGPTPSMYSPVSYGGCSSGACGVAPTAMINNNSCGCAPVARRCWRRTPRRRTRCARRCRDGRRESSIRALPCRLLHERCAHRSTHRGDAGARDHDFFHQSFRHTHRIDRVGSLVCTQHDHLFYSILHRRMQHIVGSDGIRPDGFHWMKLT